MIKKELKHYTIKKTLRLSRDVLAYSARQAIARCDLDGDVFDYRFTKGWWCRKNKKER